MHPDTISKQWQRDDSKITTNTMKNLLPFLAVIALTLPLHAVGPTAMTRGNEYPYSGLINIGYVSGSISSFIVSETFHKDISTVAGGNIAVQVDSVPSSVSVDLVANASKTVTVSSTVYTYAQAQAILQAIVAQERVSQGGPF